MQGIYSIRHLESGKAYIGSSIHVERRWKEHRKQLEENRHFNPLLQNAWNKYKHSAFSFLLLELVDREENLLNREQFWLDKQVRHYNVALDVMRPSMTPETRLKIGRAGRGRKASPETRAKLSRIRKGRKRRPEVKAKIGATQRGRKFSPERRANMRRASVGKGAGRTLTEEWKWRIGDAHAKDYPGFVAPDGTIYKDVHNLTAFCRRHSLSVSCMCRIASEKKTIHKGWTVLAQEGKG